MLRWNCEMLFLASSSCLSVLIEMVLVAFVGSNQLNKPRRSFPESFRKITFCFFTLILASTWLFDVSPDCAKYCFPPKFVMSFCDDRNSSEHVRGL